MREIPCSSGLVALVDDADYEELNRYRWLARPERNTFDAYRDDTDQKHSTILMHRQIVKPRDGFIVNYRDGNGLNNQRESPREFSTTVSLPGPMATRW